MGDCPHCDGYVETPLVTGVDLPVFSEETCPHCFQTYWLKHSRLAPVSYAEKPEGLEKLSH